MLPTEKKTVFVQFDLEKKTIAVKIRYCGPFLQTPMTALAVEISESIEPEAEFLDEIQTKILRVFLLVIHIHLYSFALRFLFLQTHATFYSFCKEQGGNLIKKQKPQV
jgi:hypothetical protein